MIFSWNEFSHNEKIKIKGLERKISKGGVFKNIAVHLKKGGRDLKEVVIGVAEELGLSGKLKAYKCGAFGITFLWGDKTVKITTNSSEADITKKIISEQKRKKLDHIIKYDSVYQLKLQGFDKDSRKMRDEQSGNVINYYAILMDQVIPLDSKKCPKDILDFYNEYMDNRFDYITDVKEAHDIAKEILKRIKRGKYKDYSNYVLDMVAIIENYNSIGIENNDIHSGNLGINSTGSLVSFDPGGAMTKSPKIKKLKI